MSDAIPTVDATAAEPEAQKAPGLVRRALDAHAWVGLLVGGAMYVVCLTGTLLVFHDLLVRWEQPDVEEFASVSPAVVGDAFSEAFSDPERVTDHLYAILPTPGLPRLRLASEDESFWVNADGSPGPVERNGFSELLVDLHYYLHLPSNIGITVVSALGALLVMLIVSGFLAHPRVLRDAFRLRRGGNPVLADLDLHNRLGVWAAPFHLMIGVTGAWFGFYFLLVGAFAALEGKEAQAVSSGLFGPEPAPVEAPASVDLEAILGETARVAPDDPAFVVTVHDAGTPKQHTEVLTRVEDRLLYSENHVFDGTGAYLGPSGFADGEPGRQVVYSLYRLHFGAFGGLPVQLVYGLLGLALTVISVTGVNAWLGRRRHRDALDDLWAGLVWGLPVALAAAAGSAVILAGPVTAPFWSAWVAALVLAAALRDPERARRWLQRTAAVALVLLAVAHGVLVRAAGVDVAPVVLLPDLVLLAVAAALLLRTRRDAGAPLVRRAPAPV
jgi:uncharacterized iron-regulated membrane protein